MITKAEIRYIITLDRRIRRGKEQMEALHEKATRCTSQISSDGSAHSSSVNSKDKYIIAMADLREDLKAADRMQHELKRKAAKYIDTIEDKLAKKVMRYRYLECFTWREITELLGYDERWLQRKESEAVSELN